MPGKSDTIFRQWAMLRLIPREPRSASTQSICLRLIDQGFVATDRTISRDLERLSTVFGYTNSVNGRANFWFWPQGATAQDIPGLDPGAALAWVLSREQLQASMPPATLRHLRPYFDRSEEVLSRLSGEGLRKWRHKFLVCHRGPQLIPASIADSVQDAVYTAVLGEKRLTISYKGRHAQDFEDRILDPLAIVMRECVLYLVAARQSDPRPVQFALHRIRSAAVLDEPAKLPKSFDLPAYVEQEFRYPESADNLRIAVRFARSAGMHLIERPLSIDQVHAESGDDLIISATVPDTAELRWWLLGFGDQAEVIAPAALRCQIRRIVDVSAAAYRKRVRRA